MDPVALAQALIRCPSVTPADAGAIDVLADNPLIGRELEHGKRELVIGRDAHGYVALYRYVEAMDTVVILAIRAQREAGYTR